MENSPYEWKYFSNCLHYVHVATSRSVAVIDINYISMTEASYSYTYDTYFDIDKLKAYVEAKIARQGVAPAKNYSRIQSS